MRNEAENSIDWDAASAAAMALGIEPSTLPRIQREEPIEPIRPLLVDPSFRLTDAEWLILEPLMPKPPVRQAVTSDDRLFLDACLFRQRASSRGLGWAFLPDELGKKNSRRGRFRRWAELGYFQRLYAELTHHPELSEKRRADLAGIAAEADRLCARVEVVRAQRRNGG